jgi:hypothetical protein
METAERSWKVWQAAAANEGATMTRFSCGGLDTLVDDRRFGELPGFEAGGIWLGSLPTPKTDRKLFDAFDDFLRATICRFQPREGLCLHLASAKRLESCQGRDQHPPDISSA